MSQPIRVCHLCSGHHVDDARVFVRQCVALAANGYDVHLIACGEQTAPYSKQGVSIHPLPDAVSRWQRLARRSQVARMAARLEPDLFHVHEPELLGPAIAAAGSRPVIWDVHESYTDVIMEQVGISKYLRRGLRLAWDRRERQLVRRCAAVIPVTEAVAKRYYAMHTRVQIITNFPDLSEWRNLPSVPRDGKTCVFVGAISSSRGLMEVVRAIGILKQRGVSVRLELAGLRSQTYVDALFEEGAKLGIRDQIAYHGILTRSDTNRLAHAASIGIVTYLPFAMNMAGWPNKMFEYMAHALPMVYSDFPMYREVAGRCEAGIAVDPTNPRGIADAIEWLVQNPELARKMGEAGRQAVWEHFSWDREKVKLLQLYEEITGAIVPRAEHNLMIRNGGTI